jgi:hypothetical protein
MFEILARVKTSCLASQTQTLHLPFLLKALNQNFSVGKLFRTWQSYRNLVIFDPDACSKKKLNHTYSFYHNPGTGSGIRNQALGSGSGFIARSGNRLTGLSASILPDSPHTDFLYPQLDYARLNVYLTRPFSSSPVLLPQLWYMSTLLMCS